MTDIIHYLKKENITMKKFKLYQADEFSPEFVKESFDTKEEAEQRLEELEKESIKHDMFTCFFIKES